MTPRKECKRETDVLGTHEISRPISSKILECARFRKFAAAATICSKKLLYSVEKSDEHECTEEFNEISVRSFSTPFPEDC